MVSASRCFCDCVIEIFKVRILIDLILIPLGKIIIMIDMDWMNLFGDIINCDIH